jgi:hypothetical protein
LEKCTSEIFDLVVCSLQIALARARPARLWLPKTEGNGPHRAPDPAPIGDFVTFVLDLEGVTEADLVGPSNSAHLNWPQSWRCVGCSQKACCHRQLADPGPSPGGWECAPLVGPHQHARAQRTRGHRSKSASARHTRRARSRGSPSAPPAGILLSFLFQGKSYYQKLTIYSRV